jgi:hypothetical protein
LRKRIFIVDQTLELKMKKILVVLLLIPFFFASCEKDDICDPLTPTTPRLVLQFFDKNNISLTRATTNLKIIGYGMTDENYLPTDSDDTTWNDTLVYLPLKANQNATNTKYKLILNAEDGDLTNDRTDTLEINYKKRDVYISRACGFKTLYDLFGDPLQPPFILNETAGATAGNWINDIQVLQSQINDENEVHIKIFF